MKVLLADIPDEGLVVDVREKPEGDDVPLVSPLEAHLELKKAGEEVFVQGVLRADVDLVCSRCLKNIRKSLEIPLNASFHPMPQLGTERHELKKDEMDLDFYKGDEIDLGDLLKEQVLLHMEIKPLCDENCRGLCPQCGKDLNTGECLCTGRATDPRLEVLKKFMNKGKE